MRGIELLHPELKAKAKQLQELCARQSIPLLITETWRTAAEQDVLYAQGRTAPGSIVTNCKGSTYSSPHQWGVAFDFCRNVKGREYSDEDGFFGRVGQLAKSIGLYWGGDFVSFKDKPHLESRTHLPGGSTKTLISKWGVPDRFKASWSGQTSQPASIPPTVKRGSKGENVKILQVRLTQYGYAVMADGDFGSKTEAALKQFQAARGLAPDGVCGPKTWAAVI